MTTEPGLNEPQWVPDPANGSCQLPLPGIPYGFVVVPLDMDAEWVAERMIAMIGALQRADREAWPQQQAGEVNQALSNEPPPPQEPDAPRPTPAAMRGPDGQRPQASRPTTGAPGNGSGNGTGSGAPPLAGRAYFCPDHRVPVRKTSARYDQDGDRYYHQLPESEWYRLDSGWQVKNHNLYARQLVYENGEPIGLVVNAS